MQCVYACQHPTKVDGLAFSQEDKQQTTSPTLSMTFCRAIFRCELCDYGLSSWLSVRPSTSLMLAGICTPR